MNSLIELLFDNSASITERDEAATCLGEFSDARVYRNNLKNRNFGKEAPQNFDSERATIADRQGASENQNCEVKPTRTKTDSSGYFGITAALLLKAKNLNENELVLNSCGESLGIIWTKLNFFDENAYRTLPGTARYGVYSIIKYRKPEWIEQYRLDEDKF